MNSLAAKNQLLDKAETLNKALDTSYLGLSLVLVDIVETEAFKEAGYDDFPSYYREHLGREKSTISRLLVCGKWLKEKYGGALPEGNPSYKKLASAIKANPEAEPEFVLATAATWSESDFKADAKEKCPGADLDLSTASAKCRACGLWHPLNQKQITNT